jgi:hypothetical protein
MTQLRFGPALKGAAQALKQFFGRCLAVSKIPLRHFPVISTDIYRFPLILQIEGVKEKNKPIKSNAGLWIVFLFRQIKSKARALTGFRLQADIATHKINQVFNNRQSQAVATKLTGRTVFNLAEAVENNFLELF